MKAILNFKGLVTGACAVGFVISCFGQAPPGWTNEPGMDKKMPGEGKWFVNWKTEDTVVVRVIEKKIVLTISDLEPFLKSVSGNKMKITSRVIPTDSRYPCIGFLGSTSDNFPAELHMIITREHVYSVFAMTLSSPTVTPSKLGFSLADWQSAISADSRMAPGDQARYETVLKDIKSKLDSGRSLTGGD